jgi:hypothetical protein
MFHSIEPSIESVGEPLVNHLLNEVEYLRGQLDIERQRNFDLSLQIADLTRKYLPMSQIEIATNGVLLSKQSNFFWEECNRNKINLIITPYPIKLNMECVLEIATRYNVQLSYFYVGDKNVFMKIPLDIKSRTNYRKNYDRCMSSNCATLRAGKLYGCYRAYCASFFNGYFGQNFTVSEKDYIDIYKVETVDEILDFECKPTPFCRYCDIDNMKFGIEWGIRNKEIREWV